MLMGSNQTLEELRLSEQSHHPHLEETSPPDSVLATPNPATYQGQLLFHGSNMTPFNQDTLQTPPYPQIPLMTPIVLQEYPMTPLTPQVGTSSLTDPPDRPPRQKDPSTQNRQVQDIQQQMSEVLQRLNQMHFRIAVLERELSKFQHVATIAHDALAENARLSMHLANLISPTPSPVPQQPTTSSQQNHGETTAQTTGYQRKNTEYCSYHQTWGNHTISECRKAMREQGRHKPPHPNKK